MNSKNRFLVYLISIFFITPVFAQPKSNFKVVIDAGHGGHDPGCVGSQVQEKEITLDVALKLGKLIQENCADVQVIYTRKTDVFVELYRRAQIANDAHANLFISIHCNASESSQGNGVETFVMGLAKSEANQAVARKENAAILKEKNYQNNYDGFNPNSPESNVLFSLYSSAYLNNSIILASKVQKNLLNVSNFTDRGVKQAGYWVLYKVAMPSILVELGFLSNSKDQAYLTQQTNIKREAVAIYNAFVDYLSTTTGASYKKLPIPSSAESIKTTNTQTPIKEENNSLAQSSNAAPSNGDTTKVNAPISAKEKVTAENDAVYFRVQFLTSVEKLSSNDRRLQGIPNVNCYHENGLWKYTAGNETDYNAALKIQEQVKAIYADTFMIAFKGDKKITIKEARELLKK